MNSPKDKNDKKSILPKELEELDFSNLSPEQMKEVLDKYFQKGDELTEVNAEEITELPDLPPWIDFS